MASLDLQKVANCATNLNTVYTLVGINSMVYVAYMYAKSKKSSNSLNNLIERPLRVVYDGANLACYCSMGVFILSKMFGDNKLINGSLSTVLGVSTAGYFVSTCMTLLGSKKDTPP
jgi:hypothetical protein